MPGESAPCAVFLHKQGWVAGCKAVQDPLRPWRQIDPDQAASERRGVLGWVALVVPGLIGLVVGALIGRSISTTSIMMTSLESLINAIVGAAVGLVLGLVAGAVLRSSVR
jgi:uncharacterized membrane protein YeaQ/YmgE (transglycosylase-associated protein family)